MDLMWENSSIVLKELTMHRILGIMIVAMFLVVASSFAAEDGAALYKSKCAACHGANGEGKPAMKAPAVKGTTLDASQIAQHITKGEPTSKAPHNKGISGVSEAQATAIAEYIKTLK
jgi:mono/diheme cytochrome c family protein